MKTTDWIRARSALLVAAMGAALVLGACANMTPAQRNMAIGAGAGAAVGGLIGNDNGRGGEGALIGAGLGAAGGYVWSRYMENKRLQMEQATAGTGIQVSQTADNRLKLNIPSDISFDTGRADIKPDMRPILDRFAQGLGDHPDVEVWIIGHTDSTGNDAINDPLSVARADSVRDYLVARGVDRWNMQTEGRGSHQPIASNATAAGRAANRRVEIYLAERAPQAQQPQPEGQTPIGTPVR